MLSKKTLARALTCLINTVSASCWGIFAAMPKHSFLFFLFELKCLLFSAALQTKAEKLIWCVITGIPLFWKFSESYT